ncbi:hypothetical protein [Oceanobacillus timonensis]|uniref:hypothetical protein n=1 Tax=Oceanobacillus timonensis TaxID=1926285 RepID=UPI0015C4A640|nr:hypothetical protein [Oceanobacillus timonensis]
MFFIQREAEVPDEALTTGSSVVAKSGQAFGSGYLEKEYEIIDIAVRYIPSFTI